MPEDWRARLDGIEAKWNREWSLRAAYVRRPEDRRPKYFATFPYSYMNGFAHLGHAFTMIRNDVMVRYQRMRGKNALFPFAFHLTGTPIAAAARRIAEGEPKQRQILIESGIPEGEVSKFADPNHWIEYFPKEWRKDVDALGLGIDWSREFFTTDRNPHYDAFVRWQFGKLSEAGLVEKGRHPVIWCPKESQPVADHDRVEGEGVTPQEYTLIKLRIETLPPSAEGHRGNGGLADLLSHGRHMGPVFLVAATLRPETMFGQTNLWLNPELPYYVVDVEEERWVVGADCVSKLANQFDKVKIVGQAGGRAPPPILGAVLIGAEVVAPARGGRIPVLPATFVRAEKGTGVVTSVPSDAPYDYIALRDLARHQGMGGVHATPEFQTRAKQILEDLESTKALIVDDAGAPLSARAVVERMGIRSQAERAALDEATQEVYNAGFYGGRMGPLAQGYEGQTVAKAKEAIRGRLIEAREAALYYEPSGTVVCRCLTPAVVKIVSDQWFIRYGEEEWKARAHDAVARMTFYPDIIRKQFDYVIDWLRDWACAREVGLGTHLPQDDRWMIESLSDSTIYMSYYTLAPHIEAGSVTGAAGPRAGVKAKDLTPAFFDYVLLGKGEAAGAVRGTVTRDVVDACRAEFLYWYPVDFRNSGKDLIQNHLTFFIFNHVAVWKDDPSKWPRGIGANGWALLNGKKMSKSAGNFLTLREGIARHGATGLRMALANAGEGIDDANVDEEFADSIAPRLAQWLDFATATNPDVREEPVPADAWFRSVLHRHVARTAAEMEKANFRSALKVGFFDLQREWAWYLKRVEKPNRALREEFLSAQTRMLTPFVPHVAEEIHAARGGKGFAIDEPYPTSDPAAIDPAAEAGEAFVRATAEDIREILKVTGRKPKRILLYTAPAWRLRLQDIASRLQAAGTLSMGTLMTEAAKDPAIRPHAKDAPKAAQELLRAVGSPRGEATESSRADERAALRAAQEFLCAEFGAPVEAYRADDPARPDPGNKAKQAAPGRAAIFIE